MRPISGTLDLEPGGLLAGAAGPRGPDPRRVALARGLGRGVGEVQRPNRYAIKGRMRLIDGAYHDVDSSVLAFEIAARALDAKKSDLPQANPEIRAALDAEIAQHGIAHLHKQLAEVDAETATRLKPTDTQRIQREVIPYRVTFRALTEAQIESYLHK